MERSTQVLLVFLILSLGIGIPTALGIAAYQRELQVKVNVAAQSIQFYADSAGTIALSTPDWGDIWPGSSIIRGIYVKNAGSIATAYHLSCPDPGFSVTWNLEAVSLAPGEIYEAMITLHANATVPQGVVYPHLVFSAIP